MGQPTDQVKEVHYPDSDGLPLGETPIHIRNMTENQRSLEIHFEEEEGFFAASNMFLYYEEGNNRRHVSPDLMVARGLEENPDRRRYLLWEEGRPPDLVVEITSDSTHEEDTGRKMQLYQELGVHEYFLFDPEMNNLNPSLQGYRLSSGAYEPIEPGDDFLYSEVLGLELTLDGVDLRFRVPGEMLPLLWHRDEHEGRVLATSRWQRAERERQEAERKQQEAERQRQEAERKQQEAERQRQEAERKLAELLKKMQDSEEP